MNKKAQFETKLFAIILIFIIGVLFLFLNHMNNQIYDSLDEYFNDTEDYNESEARTTLGKIQTADNSVWDWAFLAIFIGFIIQIVLFSFATRINIAFFWLMVIIDIPILIVGVVLSNVWQEVASNPEFATTILRFPLTNLILGTYYPMGIVFIMFITMIVLFGKPPQEPGAG